MIKTEEYERKVFIYSTIIPIIFVVLMWSVKLVEVAGNIQFAHFGIYPRSLKGLWGILFSPFIHADFSHLISNTFPLLILGTGLFYLYRQVAAKVLLLIFLCTNISVWFIGRYSYHIGASGVIYGLAAFMFVSGIISKNRALWAISLLVVFLYGGMVWGILPANTHVSYEGHFSGFLWGFVFAFLFQPKIVENEQNDESEPAETSITDFGSISCTDTDLKATYTIVKEYDTEINHE